MTMKVLWILHVWPEADSSAAGARTLRLIRACKEAHFEVHAISSCQENSYHASLSKEGVSTDRLQPNNAQFDSYISALQPNIVIFDRFMTEEQFSWRVRAHAPSALRVLDTVDLHFVRRGRERMVQRGEPSFKLSDAEETSTDALREVAAIHRSDLVLVVSAEERGRLVTRYGVSEARIAIASLFYPPVVQLTPYESRLHFVAIGNFNHPPNLDSFRLLIHELWPKLEKRFTQIEGKSPELHLYGAYEHSQLRESVTSASLKMCGRAKDAIETLSHYRINLAPLRFGAGVKGKVADGWAAGTPCVSTSIAAEGMTVNGLFGGAIADDLEQFIEAAFHLYTSKEDWLTAQQHGRHILHAQFSERALGDVMARLKLAHSELDTTRRNNVTGEILWYHQLRSTEYFSRWIEAKRAAI